LGQCIATGRAEVEAMPVNGVMDEGKRLVVIHTVMTVEMDMWVMVEAVVVAVVAVGAVAVAAVVVVAAAAEVVEVEGGTRPERATQERTAKVE
jgi:hypothetical protein